MSKKINLLEALKAQGVQLEDGQDTFLNAVSDAMNKAMEEQGATFKEAMNTAIKEVVGVTDKDDNGKVITLSQTLKELAESVDKLNVKFKVDEETKQNLRTIIKENHKTICEAFKSGKPFEFTVKDPDIHATNNGTVTNDDGVTYPLNDNFRMIPGFSAIRKPEDMLMSYIQSFQKETVNKTVLLRQQVATEGAFEIVEESGEKPLTQYKFENVQYSRLKIAARIEWTEEFERDFNSLLTAIIRLFENDLVDAWEQEVLDAIIALSTSYVGTALDGTLPVPTNALAVIAIAGQIRDLNYSPRVVVMNPSDILATMYIQDNDGHFVNQPFLDVANGRIDGMVLISSTRIPQGDVLVFDPSVLWEEHSANILRKGQYGEQFITNEYTMIAEKFFILFYAPKDTIAVIYDSLDVVKAALEVGTPSV